MNSFKAEFSKNIKGSEHVFYLTTNNDMLLIVLECVEETKYWTGDFDTEYIEKMTTKAGGYKSFGVFVKMLFSAFSQESDKLKIELLGPRSEIQKGEKYNDPLNNSQLSNTSTNFAKSSQKKYLVLQYSGEFENNNYSLPLLLIQNPTIDIMRHTIDRLRKKQESSQPEGPNSNFINYKEYEDVKQENTRLKLKVKQLESTRKYGAVDKDEIIKNYGKVHEKFEIYRNESEKNLADLSRTVEELKYRLTEGDNRNINSFVENLELEQYYNKIKDLEHQIDKLNSMILNEKEQFSKIVGNNTFNEEKLMVEINSLRENDKKLRQIVTQLEKDLDESQKKFHIALYGDLRKHKNISTPKSNYSYKKPSSVKSNYSYKSNKSNLSKNSNFSKNSAISKKSNISKGSNFSKNSNLSKNSQASKKSNYSNQSKKSNYSNNSKSKQNAKITSGGASNYLKSIKTTSKPNPQKSKPETKQVIRGSGGIDINERLNKIQNLINIAKIK